jgi:hypothetical protein
MLSTSPPSLTIVPAFSSPLRARGEVKKAQLHDLAAHCARVLLQHAALEIRGRSATPRFAEVTIVVRNLLPSWTRSLPTVRRPIYFMWLNESCHRAACSGTAIADSGRSRRCPMLSTDIAPVFYRSNRGSPPATSTTGIPGRERSQGTKTQPCPMRQRQAVKVRSIEFRSGVAEATFRSWTAYYSGACFLSRIDPKPDRAADEKTRSRKLLFRDVRLAFAPHRHDRVGR